MGTCRDWGSRTWISSFNRRTRVEGWFGNLKDHSREALTRGAFRVMGLGKTSLMLTIYAAATNLRLLDSWSRRSNHTEQPALAANQPEPGVPQKQGVSGDDPGGAPPPKA